ncbi:hypothetical protein CGLO_01358 [Colletotrichum gloeosporioides Cg-14]|uniref:Uncharacterized protein n=1 Tax=Colletotrichum gloeosporioides (strain Cg-14) TaxID=1237896 RepID=T0M498_COLGC|nr:hypothetical protein CGLO_01358 [Colletotrichum gloeosporioides Cg-14]
MFLGNNDEVRNRFMMINVARGDRAPPPRPGALLRETGPDDHFRTGHSGPGCGGRENGGMGPARVHGTDDDLRPPLVPPTTCWRKVERAEFRPKGALGAFFSCNIHATPTLFAHIFIHFTPDSISRFPECRT